MTKVEIDVELLSDLVDAAGWVGNFFTDLQSGHTPEYHPDWGAAQYLASEAVLIEQRGRAVLEAVEQSVHPTRFCACGEVIEPDEYRCPSCREAEHARG